ncbi:MAG: hypothetical protein B0A82_13740 [Alkalinema sp. CACIAM 70d]|nr:MAG: hypothetical protein B0A82_13740 [Alkalinema sp. CACIAM 70d]
MVRKILVALDRTEKSQQVLDEAIAIAQATGASLTLVHAFSFFDPEYADIAYQYPNMKVPLLQDEAVMFYLEQWQKVEKASQEYLQHHAEQAQAQGIKADYIQQLGHPEQIICEIAKQRNVDLIVIGRRGRRGLSEMFLGSVSNYIMHHAPCSVLVVQTESEKIDVGEKEDQ